MCQEFSGSRVIFSSYLPGMKLLFQKNTVYKMLMRMLGCLLFRAWASSVRVWQIHSDISLPIPVRPISCSSPPGPLPPWEPCGPFGPGSPRPSSHHPLPLLCAAPHSQPLTGPPDAVCPAQTATAHCHCEPTPVELRNGTRTNECSILGLAMKKNILSHIMIYIYI